ncbi:hypothetical protein, partial [Desulfovibrio piger]|uniref:hypothetical protein n=1 Tax=Desulfovibrio piger TaxID=901 RepID=UPI0026EC4152
SCQLNDSPSRKWNLRKTGSLVNKKIEKILRLRIRQKKCGSGQEGSALRHSHGMLHYKIFHMISNLLIFHGDMMG